MFVKSLELSPKNQCNAKMEKAYNSKEISKWETMNKDILVAIFNKLDVMDLTMGASRVCISWFLASHDKTLWQTVNLAKLQLVVFSYSPWWKTVVLYNHRVDDEVEEVRPSFRNVLVKKMINFCSCMQGEVEKGTSLRKLLIEITNFSGTLPKNLILI
ncbi:unnamed protein product [Arabis nemorensis]|uniref:F-box domain-containing protein n=1 Tax=Arabis nemorensis TaxID=586526 RepID=A0A565BXA7_9BRAS|nr:unnamed protein product [Arabis nemorensis]